MSLYDLAPARTEAEEKIKLDENMPLRLAGILAKLGHQTDTVPEESFSACKSQFKIGRTCAKCLKQGDDFSVCFHVSGT